MTSLSRYGMQRRAHTIRVLIVTNNSKKAGRLRERLAIRGFVPYVASYEQTASASVLTQTPDVLLADLENTSSEELDGLTQQCRTLGVASVIYFGSSVAGAMGACASLAGAPAPTELLFALDEALAERQTLSISSSSLREAIAGERARTASALEEAEGRYRTLFEYAPDGILIANADGFCIDANASMCRMLGYTKHEFVGKRASEILSPSDVQLIEPTLQQLNAGRDLHRIWRFRRKDGSMFEGDTISTVMPDGRFLGVVRDITEQRQWGQRIDALNRIYSMLSAVNQLIVREHDLATLLTNACRIAVNDGNFALAWIGMIDEADGFEPVAHSGATAETLDVLNEIFSTGGSGCVFTEQALKADKHSVCSDIEHDPAAAPWRAKALERGYLSMVSLPLTIEGRVRGTFNLYADRKDFFDERELVLLDQLAIDVAFAIQIMERERQRRRALQGLRSSEERFRLLAETIGDVFWITDGSGSKVEYVSPAFEKLWQLPRQSFYERPGVWLGAIHPDDRDRALQVFRARCKGSAGELEYRIVRGDGEIRWIRDRSYPIRDESNQVTRLVGVARDITERKELQQQLLQSQKMQAIGTLAGGIAHDFNNLLAIILGNANLAAQDVDRTQPAYESIQEILRAGGRARELVQRILTFSSPQEQNLRVIDLEPVVAEAVKLLRSTLPAGVALTYRATANLPPVRADASQIHQIILNLVTNAWHAIEGPSGEIHVRIDVVTVDDAMVELHPDLHRGSYVCLSVRDTGKGMDSATLNRVFEPFFTTKPAGRGVGLGLAMVHGIVRGHGGAIAVSSVPNVGSTFRVYLPYTGEVRTSSSPTTTPAAAVEKGAGQRILYVDDEDALVFLAQRAFERLGYQVRAYTDPRQALQDFRTHPDEFDLILSDLNMPEMSGMELAAEILRIRPDTLIALTSGYLRTNEVEDAKKLGIREIIVKPNTPTDFGPIVQRLLRKN